MPRALPMPPEERRAAIMAATEPLVEQFGRDVTTRQIADAAGVAEGTIFRVFPTKDALVDAVIDDVFDVSVTCRELTAVATAAGLEQRLIAATQVLQDRTRRLFAIFHAIGRAHDPPADDLRRKREVDEAALNQTLAAVLAPYAGSFRLPVDAVAQQLRAVSFALSHPMISGRPSMPPAEIVTFVLYGVTTRTRPPHLEEVPPC